jgi:outer membrane cobalamin receptor
MPVSRFIFSLKEGILKVPGYCNPVQYCRSKKKLFLLTGILTIAATSLYSQSDSKDSTTLEDVIVTTGTGVKVNKNNIPMSVSVVTRKQIEESNESALLPVLNGRVPGLFVTERGITGFGVSNNAAGQITIRGIGENPTTGILILIDGHPQFMGIMGHTLSDSYIASDAERVEVIRGPASILYGSNAMGGVINIITRKNTQDGFQGNARVMYGSFNTQKYMASGGYKKDKFSSFISVNHDQTDGHRAHSDFNITNGYLKLGYELTRNIKINTDFSLAKFKTTDPGPDTLHAETGSSLNITRGYWAFTVENDFTKYSGSAKVFYNFGTHDISDGFHSTDINYGINLSESAKLMKGNALTIGTDFTQYGGKANQNMGAGGTIPFIDTTVHEAGVYGFVQQTLFNKLVLNAGIRLQNNSVYGNEWVPSGGFAYKIFSNTTWKANVSKGFRSPTIRELFMWNHNPLLNPERIMNYETGILQSLCNHKLNLELTGFIVKGDNLIVTGAMGALFNGGMMDNKGIEFAANATANKNLSFNFTYSYTHMQKPVYATPKHHLYLSSSYNWNKLQLTASIEKIIHLNTQPDITLAPYYLDYTLVNFKVSYKVSKLIGVFCSAENLLNQQYETLRYYPMPGTSVFGGINIKL